MSIHAVFAGLIGLLLAGCTTIGPQSVQRDRFDYNKASVALANKLARIGWAVLHNRSV
jgi:starvation-inducible outer membrane lipoprotein